MWSQKLWLCSLITYVGLGKWQSVWALSSSIYKIKIIILACTFLTVLLWRSDVDKLKVINVLTITAHRIWGSKGKECSSCEQTKTERALRDPEATALSRTKISLREWKETHSAPLFWALYVFYPHDSHEVSARELYLTDKETEAQGN